MITFNCIIYDCKRVKIETFVFKFDTLIWSEKQNATMEEVCLFYIHKLIRMVWSKTRLKKKRLAYDSPAIVQKYKKF